MTSNLDEFPEPGLRDAVRVGADASIAAVPLVGGSLQILLQSTVVPSLEKRRNAWLRELGVLVSELNDKVDDFDISSLIDNDMFVTALVEASRIAAGTHLEEKLTILKNCLAHLAIDQSSTDFLSMLFFRFVDELQPEHFVILKYFAAPRAWFDAKEIEKPSLMSASAMHLAKLANLPLSDDELELALRDLGDRGLLEAESLRGMSTQTGMWAPKSTELGNQLLRFTEDI